MEAERRVQPCLVEGSRLQLPARGEGECRDSSTPLPSPSETLAHTAQNDMLHAPFNGVVRRVASELEVIRERCLSVLNHTSKISS